MTVSYKYLLLLNFLTTFIKLNYFILVMSDELYYITLGALITATLAGTHIVAYITGRIHQTGDQIKDQIPKLEAFNSGIEKYTVEPKHDISDWVE